MTPATPAVESSNLLSLLAEQGGWTIWPLALCSVVALAIIIERLFFGPRKNREIPAEFREEALTLVRQGEFERLAGRCQGNRSAAAKVTLAALEASRTIGQDLNASHLSAAIESAGRKISAQLEKYLEILGIIAAISPLLGLLGTVFGMIETFRVISLQGTGNATGLAGGISEALLSTATGLCIAIPALVFFRIFKKQHQETVTELENYAAGLVQEISSKNYFQKLSNKV